MDKLHAHALWVKRPLEHAQPLSRRLKGTPSFPREQNTARRVSKTCEPNRINADEFSCPACRQTEQFNASRPRATIKNPFNQCKSTFENGAHGGLSSSTARIQQHQ